MDCKAQHWPQLLHAKQTDRKTQCNRPWGESLPQGVPAGLVPWQPPHWALSPLAKDEACSRGAAVSGWALLLECPLGCWAAGGEIKQTPGCFILCRGLAPGAGKRKGGLKTAAFFCCLVGSFFPLRTSGPLLACVLWAEQTLWPWTCNAQRTLSR